MATPRHDPRGRARGAAEVDAARDPMVAGSREAVELLDGFRADPDEPFAVAVLGPGGSGKSALVAAYLRSARRRGVPVRRVRAGEEVDPAEDAVLLVDDAHALDREILVALTDVADDPDARLLVTARPSPRPPGASSLRAALGRARAPVVLGPLPPGGVADRIGAVLGHRCPPPLAELVAALTGGVPALVDRLAVAVRDGGPGALAASAERGATEVPPGALDHLRAEVEALDDGSRRLLLALATGAPAAPPALAEVLEVERTVLDDLLERVRAAGLLVGEDVVPPLVRRAAVLLAGTDERLALGRRIAGLALASGTSVLDAARPLSGAGLRGGDLPAVFTAAGDEALGRAPELAGALYADAVAAGAAPRELVVRRAEAAALAADLDTAVRLADPVTADPSAPDRDRALVVVATVMAHRGMAVRGAAVLADAAAAGPDAGAPAALAVPPLVATGSVDRARALVEPGSGAGGGGTSSMLRSAVELTAAGVLASVGPAPGTALSSLIRAASLMEPIGSAVLLPDTPSALAALVAVHGGELDVADSVLRRAVAAGTGGRAMAARHRLLQAWIAMTRGDAAGARELAAAATPVSGVFEPRDELFAAALEVGIARRVGDSAGLRTAWGRAREALVRHPVDLFVLQPLGELTVGAARLREGGAVRAAWAEAEALLTGLGDPPLWRLTTSWHGLAAAVTAEDVPAAERHGALLEELAGTGPFAAALATAARTWLRALAGDIVPTEVEAAARGLHRLGWAWDGARLAGEAAIRTADRRAMATLLACARSLSDNGRPGTDGAPVGLPTSGLPGDTGEVSLSDREREVAQLVLAGLTHKQIGARLYISSKTVEHHVARMRQRLGSGSRGELFAQLRELVGDRDG